MHKNAFTPNNAAMLLIDHQVGTMAWTHSHDIKDYEVQVSADASASYTKYGDELALRRMEKAGAVITTMDQIISELAIDWTSPNGQKLMAILGYQ